MDFYAGLFDAEIDTRIEALPPHLGKIFLEMTGQGLDRRHALFIASSFSWKLPEENGH